MLLLTSLPYFLSDILYIFLALSTAKMISMDEFIFLMSFFKTCQNLLNAFLNLVLCINETKSFSKSFSSGM